MRLLIVDPNGNGLDFAYRAKEAGHHVKLCIRDTPKTNHIGLGLVDVVREFQPFLEWADLVFNTDNTRYLRDLDSFRVHGTPIIGASQETAQWELDRGCGVEVLKQHGIAVPPYQEFNDYDEAIRYVKKRGTRLVSKPSGDADKSLSYCAKTPADLVYMLERWKRNPRSVTQPLLFLQDFVDGCEMAVGGWFGPHGWNAGWCENFEFKKLMDGDLGVATGEQGTVLRYVSRSRLARLVLEPLTDALAALDYCGYIDVNCIIDEKGTPWPLEFTMRPGWPTFNIQQELHGDPVEWLWDLASGKDARAFTMNTIALGVVLSIPDYPYSHLTQKEVIGSPIYGLTPRLMNHVHFCEAMMGKDVPVDHEGSIVKESIPVTAGDYVLVMSATGQTVYDAKQTAYRRLKKLMLPNSPMYRTDIGDRLSKQLPELQKLGFAMGMEFSTSPPP